MPSWAGEPYILTGIYRVCYNIGMDSLPVMTNYEANFSLAEREAILDYEFLNDPRVIAQRILIEYVKQCLHLYPHLL